MYLTKELLTEKHLPDTQVAWFTSKYPQGVLAQEMLHDPVACEVDAHWLYYMLVNQRRKDLLEKTLEKQLRLLLAEVNKRGDLFQDMVTAAVNREIERRGHSSASFYAIRKRLLATRFKHRYHAVFEANKALRQKLYAVMFLGACDIPDTLAERARAYLHDLYFRVVAVLVRMSAS
jgi:hypothetical protein